MLSLSYQLPTTFVNKKAIRRKAHCLCVCAALPKKLKIVFVVRVFLYSNTKGDYEITLYFSKKIFALDWGGGGGITEKRKDIHY